VSAAARISLITASRLSSAIRVAGEDVRAAFLLAQLVLRTAGDDLALEVEEVRDELEQRQRARNAVDERRRRSHRTSTAAACAWKSLFSATCGIASRFTRSGCASPSGSEWSARSEISVSTLLVDEVGDLLDHTGVAALLHAVGQLGDDDRALAAAQLFDVARGRA